MKAKSRNRRPVAPATMLKLWRLAQKTCVDVEWKPGGNEKACI